MVACLAVAGAVVGPRWLLRRAEPWGFSVTPPRVMFAFVVSVWFLFTTLGLQGNSRLLPEPTVAAFPNSSPATLQALRHSFDDLKAKGCLGPARTSDRGVSYHALQPACLQQAFATRVLPQLLVVLVVTLDLPILGGFLLIRLRTP